MLKRPSAWSYRRPLLNLSAILNSLSTIEQVSSFIYLGALVISDGCSKPEIRCRITISKLAFAAWGSFWQIENYRCQQESVSSSATSGQPFCTAASLGHSLPKWNATLWAAELWFYRRMLIISYMDRVTNDEALNQIHQEVQLLRRINIWQTRFLGHCIRKE